MSNIDLNLIRTFVILYETRSVTKTADLLFVTQPSVSYALSRLRDLFKDKLFIRNKNGMEPTAISQQLYEEFSHSLSMIENTVANVQTFDPAVSHKRFRVAMTDLGEMALLPAIVARLQIEAPNIEMKVIPLEIDKVDEWMSSGKIDAVICSRPIEGQHIQRHVMIEEHYVCVRHKQFASDKPLTMEAFIAHKHALVTNNLGHGATEDVLAQMGVKRKISLEVSHFLILPSVLAKADLLAILPYRIALFFAQNNQLTLYDLPFDVPAFSVALHWQSRHNESASHRWFRELIISALSTH
ncbi:MULTISPECIES: LysR family transcriptional regulator [unclassified Marinomonas]|uniref:LysR family transcriptional regulator n=1 Tax=unclassified Marinomonas TaxID=196814 RepID=UPI000C1E2FD8|nr:LysR family transcriptional regulator [Marinomonas sp. BSi20584]PJE53821.1 LysR family transcriptional regulator [Marinomonas sp. BSi20584]